jgi:hypothetical protein
MHISLLKLFELMLLTLSGFAAARNELRKCHAELTVRRPGTEIGLARLELGRKIILGLTSGSHTTGFQVIDSTVSKDVAYPRSFQKRVLEEVRAKRIVGRVTATRGSLISGNILVEIIENERTERRIQAKFADENGRFDFSSLKLGRMVWLKLSMPGFDTVFVQVRVDRKAPDELGLELPPAT